VSHSSCHVATGRRGSLYAETLAARAGEIAALIRGRRILAVGAAGSIGSNTVATLSRFEPRALHLIDQNENTLAELVRQHWSRNPTPQIDDFRTLPLDYGAPVTGSFLQANGPYDLVMNFAAIKHVRSEKNNFSLIQMFDTNIVKQARFLGWLAEFSPEARYFCVSTDKAANPASFMGASKRIMEHVLFAQDFTDGQKGAINSARFANVAFSNGSLLQSFENRLARNEPLACPQDIRRYFVSLEESGHICTLALLFAPDRHIAIPDLDPRSHLVALTDVAEAFLRNNGFEPAYYKSGAEAKAAVAQDRRKGRWPLILTPANTAGEKPYEEFVASEERSIDIGLGGLKAVRWAGPPGEGSVRSVVAALEDIVLGRKPIPPRKDALKDIIASLEPAFLDSHIESDINLDQRA